MQIRTTIDKTVKTILAITIVEMSIEAAAFITYPAWSWII